MPPPAGRGTVPRPDPAGCRARPHVRRATTPSALGSGPAAPARRHPRPRPHPAGRPTPRVPWNPGPRGPRSTARCRARPCSAGQWCARVPPSRAAGCRAVGRPRACRLRTSSSWRGASRSRPAAGSCALRRCRIRCLPRRHPPRRARYRVACHRRRPTRVPGRVQHGRCPRRPHPRCRRGTSCLVASRRGPCRRPKRLGGPAVAADMTG